jgi:glycosyltransferase involved in cell wall biosynthesis
MRLAWVTDKLEPSGGATKLLPAATRILAQHGHEVVPFVGLREANGIPAAWIPFQPPEVGRRSALGITRRAWPDAAVTRSLESFIRAVRPVAVVVQNVDQYLSLDVLRTLRREAVPTVLLVNDHALYCVNKYGFRKGGPCHRCVDRRFLRGAVLGCSLKSLPLGPLESVVRATALTAQWREPIWEAVGAIYTNGSRMIDTLSALGADPSRIVEGVFPMDYEPPSEPLTNDEDPYIVYYGSSLPVKGIPVLLDALRHLVQPIRLRLYVLHPSEALRVQVKEIRETTVHSVELDEDSRWTSGVRDAVARARAVVVPSAWHGPQELVAYESMSLGKALVVSSGSGNADLVRSEEDGLVFPMNDSQALAQVIDRVWRDPGLAERLGSNARRTYERVLHPDRWYEAFMRAIAMAQGDRTDGVPMAGRADG